MPAFSAATSARVGPSHCTWSSPRAAIAHPVEPELHPEVRADEERRLELLEGHPEEAPLSGEQPEHLREAIAHLLAMDDGVDHSVLQQELAGLESLGQLLPQGLLDDARP